MKKIVSMLAALVLAAGGSAVAAPEAQALNMPGAGCSAWFTWDGVAGRCKNATFGYQIEPLCKKWGTNTTVYTPAGPYVRSPYTSRRACPWGTSASGGVLWSAAAGNVAWVSR